MIDFWRALPGNELLAGGVLAGLLAAIACGATGPLVVARGLVLLVGAIAHVAVGGVGLALYVRHRWPEAFGWLEPTHGALVVSVAAAIGLAVVRRRAGDRLDMLVGAIWAAGMSAGLLAARSVPGGQAELNIALFGNLAAVPQSTLITSAVLTAAILVSIGLVGRRLLVTTIDADFARTRGMSVDHLEMFLLVLVALAVVILVQVTGLLLVLALLTLPAATVGHWARRLWSITLLAGGLAAILATVPRAAVYGTALPPEAAIVGAAALTYLASLMLRGVLNRRTSRRLTA
ncbi:MAG: metal ABC transporter permease [Phycisphaerales bacterium]